MSQNLNVEIGGEEEKFRESLRKSREYPIPVDIDDGIERDITIEQEIFGEIYQYSTKFEVMRFTLSNKGKDSIRVQVLSLGATLASIKAPDRKGNYEDIVLGFDNVNMYYGTQNPGFGRITSLCPLPYNLEKIVWDYDFDRDEGSVTFSTAFYKIDVVLVVKYTLTTTNEIIVDIKCCGAKILPMSLTSQVYWNLAGHFKGEEFLKQHVLSLNSNMIWRHDSHDLKNFIGIGGTPLDFRIPTFLKEAMEMSEDGFEEVYVAVKGSMQKITFLARLIHPRSCRYVEIFSDHPWMFCNTLNKMPKVIPEGYQGKKEKTVKKKNNIQRKKPVEKKNTEKKVQEKSKKISYEYLGEDGYVEIEKEKSDEDVSEINEVSEVDDSMKPDEIDDIETDETDEQLTRPSVPSVYLDEIPGKENAFYHKYGSICITPSSDLSGFDPILRPGKPYVHRIVYKVGIYRRYMKQSSKPTNGNGEENEKVEEKEMNKAIKDRIVDIEKE